MNPAGVGFFIYINHHHGRMDTPLIGEFMG